jgi:hypothetical protein
MTKWGYSAWEREQSSFVDSHNRSFDFPPVNEGIIYALQSDFLRTLPKKLSLIQET